jgi:hypothetical protein
LARVAPLIWNHLEFEAGDVEECRTINARAILLRAAYGQNNQIRINQKVCFLSILRLCFVSLFLCLDSAADLGVIVILREEGWASGFAQISDSFKNFSIQRLRKNLNQLTFIDESSIAFNSAKRGGIIAILLTIVTIWLRGVNYTLTWFIVEPAIEK